MADPKKVQEEDAAADAHDDFLADEALDAFAEEAEDAAFEFPEDDFEAVKAERDELKDRLLRSMAEAENSRKRGERDRRDAELYGGTRLARDILSVYDNLARALETVDDQIRADAPGLIEGIELTQKELVAAFSKHKILPVSPEFGDKFDPKLHQAMFEAPVPNAPAGTIIQVMNVGFTIGDRLLRPAQVGVSSTPASQVKSEPAEPEQD